MEKHQTNNEIKKDTAEALKRKTNQDFNGKKPLPNDPQLDESAGEIKEPDEKTKDEEIREDEPLNPIPEQKIEGDSDAPTTLNKKDSNILKK